MLILKFSKNKKHYLFVIKRAIFVSIITEILYLYGKICVFMLKIKFKKVILKIEVVFVIALFCFSSVNAKKINRDTHDINIEEKDMPQNGKYYALIIGIERFMGIEDLPEDKLDDGAISIYNLFVNSKNWKEENIKILLNENATKENIKDSIVNWLDERETENDFVVYYFAGHSLKMPILKRNLGHTYSFPYNITDFEYSEDKITDDELASWLDELESNHQTLILDTCYSGKMISLRQKNRVMLTAGGKHFFCGVDESDTLGSNIFTFFLLQGFKGLADINNDGWVTSEEAFRYAKIPTIISSIWQQFPFIQEWNNKTIIWFFQVPTMYDQYLGSMKLVEYQYY